MPYWMDDPDYEVGEDSDDGALARFCLLSVLLVASVIAYHAVDFYMKPPEVFFNAPVPVVYGPAMPNFSMWYMSQRCR